MNKEKIQYYISRAEIENALNLLECENTVLYKQRYSSLKRSHLRGTISFENYTLEFNKISQAILSEIGADEIPTPSFENELVDLIARSKRPNPEINDKSNKLFDEYQLYLSNKANDPLYDSLGRRLTYFNECLQTLHKEFSEFKDDVKSSSVEEIRQLLAEPLPSDDKIKLALDKCIVRGFKPSHPVELDIMSKFDKFDLIEDLIDFCKK